jgi:tRNA pseudouridine13 synthase
MKEMPKGMDIERQLISQLVAGKGPIAALRAIPIQIRRLFVQAYQAHIFNRCLSKLIAQGEDVTTPKHGDLCFWMEGPFVFGKIKKFESFTAAATTSTTATAEAASPPTEMRMIPAVRMVGYTFQPGKGRFEAATKELLLQDRIAAKDFYIKEMQELSQQGGFRQAPLCCKDFTWKQKNSPEVSFKLPKGSYATTLLRELIKPADPIKSGF